MALKKGISLKNKPIFYDTDCLACFLIIDECSVLFKMFSKVIIPEPVFDEFFIESTPKNIKNNLNLLINSGFVEVKEISILSKEYSNYRCIEKGYWGGKSLGKGEASVIALAIENNGMVASNNISDVKKLTDEFNLSLLTTAIILGKSVEKNIITQDKAEMLWKKMLNRNRHLPDSSFHDYYSKRYKNDCKNFLKY
jgi:predicted nucleic acid-binding protein